MKAQKPYVVCITGGIGSGKSVVSRVLRLNGFHVYDCDSKAKVLMERDEEVKSGLIEILGDESFDNEGKLNRKFIADIIFTDTAKRGLVNRLVHEAVRKDFRRYAKDCLRSSKSSKLKEEGSFSLSGESVAADVSQEYGGVVFCETAIPVSSHLDEECERIWVVEAPEELRIERVILRNGLGVDEIRERMMTQTKEFDMIPSHKKRIIDNSGLKPVLTQIFENLEILKFTEEICLKKF